MLQCLTYFALDINIGFCLTLITRNMSLNWQPLPSMNSGKRLVYHVVRHLSTFIICFLTMMVFPDKRLVGIWRPAPANHQNRYISKQGCIGMHKNARESSVVISEWWNWNIELLTQYVLSILHCLHENILFCDSQNRSTWKYVYLYHIRRPGRGACNRAENCVI